MQVPFMILMFVLGSVFGSFLCCQARRLRRKATGEKPLGKWSVCENCGKKLKWCENVPIFSWLFLRGRCKKCHEKIGAAEFLSELGGAFMFLALASTFSFGNVTPFAISIYIITVLLGIFLLFLAIYDGLYGELPTFLLTFSAICAILLVILRQWSLFSVGAFELEGVAVELGGAVALGGLYLLLYIVSKGRWVGDGDWILAAVIGLSLGSPWLSIWALLIANLSASLIIGPAVLIKKKDHLIYFGPFLVVAWVVVSMLSSFLTNLI